MVSFLFSSFLFEKEGIALYTYKIYLYSLLKREYRENNKRRQEKNSNYIVYESAPSFFFLGREKEEKEKKEELYKEGIAIARKKKEAANV